MFADIVARQVGEDGGTGVVEADAYSGLAFFVAVGLCVVDVFPGQLYLLANQQGMGLIAGSVQQFVALGYVAVRGRLKGVGVVAHHADFQRGGTPDDVFGFGRVLHAGQLHDDAVYTRLLDNRFGYAQFVHTVVQGVDVLRHGLFADIVHGLFRKGENQAAAVAGERGFGEHVFERRQDFVQVGFVLEGDGQAVVVLHDGADADFFTAQLAADVAGVAVEGFLHRGLHVHLHGEMHAAAQVEAEEHRVGTDFRHPLGRVGDLVEGGDVAFAQGAFNHRTRLHLGLRIFETHFQRAVGDEHAVVGNVGHTQGFADARFGLAVDGEGLAVGRNLHRQGVAEEVRQGIEQAQAEYGENQQVFPQGITVHNQTFGMRPSENPVSDGLFGINLLTAYASVLLAATAWRSTSTSTLRAISTVKNFSPTLVILPVKPEARITLSPVFSSASMAWWALNFFCCGRRIRK